MHLLDELATAASPLESHDSQLPGREDISAEQNDGGRPGEVSTLTRKGKKRVSFCLSSNDSPTEERQTSGTGEGILSLSASSQLIPRRMPPGAPDAMELSIGQTNILAEEQEGIDHQQETQDNPSPTPTALDSSGLKSPSPELRRNTSYDALERRQEVDVTDSPASVQELISMSQARQKATSLAVSVSIDSATRVDTEPHEVIDQGNCYYISGPMHED